MSLWKSTGIVACLATAMSLSAMAQAQTPPPGPPADGQKQGPPPGDRPDGPPPMRDGQDGPPPREGQDGPPPRDGGGQGQGGQRPPRPDGQGPTASAPGVQGDVNRFQGYLTMVGQYTKLAGDPESSGVAAVVSAGDVLRRKGPQAAIDYFTKVLPDVKMDAVKRAIRLQLIDLYKANKQEDKALEQLQILITADAPATASLMKQ